MVMSNGAAIVLMVATAIIIGVVLFMEAYGSENNDK